MPNFSRLIKLAKLVNVNPEQGKMIANAYEQMRHNPDDPNVKAAYEALIRETGDQYQDMIDSGFKVSKIKPDQSNPYRSSKDLHSDIEENKHLSFFPTSQGFGTEADAFKHHPLLQSTKYAIDDNPLLANDLFRIVHDYRGHHLGGKTSFGPKGEHQAYLKHKEDFSPSAQEALATETMGQNSWVNFGPHGDANQTTPLQTVYADQKAGLLPKELIEGNWHASNPTDEDIQRFKLLKSLLEKNK